MRNLFEKLVEYGCMVAAVVEVYWAELIAYGSLTLIYLAAVWAW